MAVVQRPERPGVLGSENGFYVSGRSGRCTMAMAGFNGQKYDPPKRDRALFDAPRKLISDP